jgi:DNA repair protein RadC
MNSPRKRNAIPETKLGRLTVTMRCMEEAEIGNGDCPSALAEYWQSHIATSEVFDNQKEMLAVLLLDTKLKVFGWSIVSIGTVNETLAHPREIMRPVIVSGAYAFALMHNHPSGVTTASSADANMTKRVREASELMQIRFLDHVIVGSSPFGDNERHFSFRESGQI